MRSFDTILAVVKAAEDGRAAADAGEVLQALGF